MIHFLDKERQTEIWYTIRTNKRRSVMTSMGVFFGMFIFTVLLSIGIGMENGMNRQIESVSSNLTAYMLSTTTRPYQGYKNNRRLETTYDDYLQIKKQSKTLSNVVCSMIWENQNGGWMSTINSTQKKGRGYMMGVSTGYLEQNRPALIAGRLLSDRDIVDKKNVCVIGMNVLKSLFDSPEDALGKHIFVSGMSFQVIGVTGEANMQVFGPNSAYSAYIPLPFVANDNPEANVLLLGTPKQDISEEEVKEELFSYFSRKYHIHPEDKDVLISAGMRIIFGLFGMITGGIKILVWLIGMGTLITGIISVSNILLVTVRERQREIGVRRALGAKPRDIFEQFILESVFIISLAGFTGLFLGLLVALGIGSVVENINGIREFIVSPYPQLHILIISILIVLVSGILAGLLPVYKALEVKAIDAIRDE